MDIQPNWLLLHVKAKGSITKVTNGLTSKKDSKMFAISHTSVIFVVPNAYYVVVSTLHTFIRNHKAGLSCDTSLTSSGRLATIQERLASFLSKISNFQVMPNASENLKAHAQGASASRIPTKRGIKPYSQLKREGSPRKHLYKVRSGGSCKKNFAEIENVCIFVMQNRRNHVTHKVHTTRLIRRCPSSASTDVVASVLQNLTGATLSFLRKPQILSTLNF